MSEEGSYNQGGWRWQDARGCCWDVRDCVRGAWREYGPWWARSWRAGAATFADERIREKAGGFGPRRLPGRLQAGEGEAAVSDVHSADIQREYGENIVRVSAPRSREERPPEQVSEESPTTSWYNP